MNHESEFVIQDDTMLLEQGGGLLYLCPTVPSHQRLHKCQKVRHTVLITACTQLLYGQCLICSHAESTVAVDTEQNPAAQKKNKTSLVDI